VIFGVRRFSEVLLLFFYQASGQVRKYTALDDARPPVLRVRTHGFGNEAPAAGMRLDVPSSPW